MSLKKLPLIAVSALMTVAFTACDNDSGSLNVNDMGLVENAAGTTAKQTSTKSVDEQAGTAVVANDSATASDEGQGVVNQVAAQDAGQASVDVLDENPVESQPSSVDSASLDSIIAILFPNGIDIDTARHDPDSVGVWHFYDPKESHMNPNFAYGEMTDPRDGIVYKTTTIGGQVWMAENLNYFDIEGAASSIKNDWCYWDKPENCESAGRLYTWKVAKRVCPEGWRLPTKEDWQALLTAVGADTLNPIAWTGANVLKSVNGWENNGSGTDDFGFTALPAGKAFFNDLQSGFTNHGCSSYMWSATEPDIFDGADTLAFSVELNCSNELVIVNTIKKYSGLSVRCVKN
jgi:uncharacterized protein (TIGR02145 family)